MCLVLRAIACESVQSYALDYAAVNADETTQCRLASERKNKLGRFAIEYPSYKSTVVRLRLARRKSLPESVLKKLLVDKYIEVQTVAQKTALKS